MSKIKEPRGRGKLKDLFFFGLTSTKNWKNKNSKYFVIVLYPKQTVFVKKFVKLKWAI